MVNKSHFNHVIQSDKTCLKWRQVDQQLYGSGVVFLQFCQLLATSGQTRELVGIGSVLIALEDRERNARDVVFLALDFYLCFGHILEDYGIEVRANCELGLRQTERRLLHDVPHKGFGLKKSKIDVICWQPNQMTIRWKPQQFSSKLI